jgi:hypothetical protein
LDNASLIKHPSVYLPLAMSIASLALVVGHVAVFGVLHEADEGTAAYIWQILIAAQLPLVIYFMLGRLPKRLKGPLLVLALLAGTWFANLAAVFWLT